MPVLDVNAIRLKKEATERKQAEAAAWCHQAIGEFFSAAQELETPSQGNPEFLKTIYGQDAWPGVWPILREWRSDNNFILQIGFGASVTMSGRAWLSGKEAPSSDLAWWIAARCHYSIEVMAEVFEAALLGTPWDDQTALKR